MLDAASGPARPSVRPGLLGLALASAGCFYTPHGTPQTATTDEPPGTSSGGDTTTGDTTTIDAPPTGTTTTTTGDGETIDPTAGATCEADDACAPMPYCVEGACGDCRQAGDPDAFCAARDADSPVCGESGVCVQCTPERADACEGFTPYCDPGALACAACSAHEHCPDSACNLASGACLPLETVLYIDSDADCVAGDGSEATPYCTIGEAMDLVGADDEPSGWTIRARGEFGNFAVPEDRIVAIVGVGPEPARFVGTTEFSLFWVVGATAFFDRVELTSGYGIQCTDGLVWLDRSASSHNKYAGIEAKGCITTIRRSVLHDNPVGVEASQPGETVLVNSFVAGNDQGISLAVGAALRVVFSTVVENASAEPGAAHSLTCAAAGEVSIRNSVVMAPGTAQIDCPGAVVSHSAITPADVDGEMNLTADAIDVTLWFDPPKEGVYRVRPNAPLGELGRWQPGDPRDDFDGEARPTVADAPEWAGADRP